MVVVTATNLLGETKHYNFTFGEPSRQQTEGFFNNLCEAFLDIIIIIANVFRVPSQMRADFESV